MIRAPQACLSRAFSQYDSASERSTSKTIAILLGGPTPSFTLNGLPVAIVTALAQCGDERPNQQPRRVCSHHLGGGPGAIRNGRRPPLR